jgi:hypothetical protein
MRAAVVSTSRVLGVVLGVAVAAACPAQEKSPVHKMEIYNGPSRSVYYFALNLSPGENAALRELERSENAASYADDLLALRRLYTNSELFLEPRRQTVQSMLYGTATESTFSAYAAGASYGPASLGYYYPYAYGGGYAGFGYGNGYGSSLAPGFALSSTNTVSHNLAYGVGYEGAMKNEMARTIAAQATPDFTAGTSRGYANAVANASDYPRLRQGLGITQAAAEAPRQVTVSFKAANEPKIEGKLLSEDADWIRVETATDVVDVRKADVARITRSKGK